MKKHNLFLVLTLLIVICVTTCCFIMNNNRISAVEELAAFGEEQFLAIDFQTYIETLRDHGLSDLSAEISTSYDYKHDYDEETKTLYLSCNVDRITSDKIDNYFTTEYNGSTALKLGQIMQSIRAAYALRCEYTSDAGDTVILSIQEPLYRFSIYTSSGREYKYSFGHNDYVYVEIDGNWVYHGDVFELLPERPRGTHMPYIGMPESEIDTTCLGKPTTKERCRDFYYLRAYRQSTKYTWYENDIQDLEHLKCIVTISYYDYKTDREVPGYVDDIMIYD